MQIRLLTIAAALAACSVPAWADQVEIYGSLGMSMDLVDGSLPTHGTYSAAADIGTNFFSGVTYIPQSSITTLPGETASIAQLSPIPAYPNYSLSATTTLGSNHTYAQASAFPLGVLAAASASGWYDQVTITGGTGTGTAQFTVQLNGTVDVGAIIGGMAYTLGTSSIHPSQLTSDFISFDLLNSAQAWPMDAVTPIATYLVGASPYTDTSILFGAPDVAPGVGIPDIQPGLGGTMLPTPVFDQLLTPGAGQVLSATLSGTFTFTYGEAFYLVSGMGTALIGDGLEAFCGFPTATGDACSPAIKDGTGATTLDFSNSANLINIALPQGAIASFASGAAYNVTAVPEPSQWLMLLAGLGLVGWATRRHA